MYTTRTYLNLSCPIKFSALCFKFLNILHWFTCTCMIQQKYLQNKNMLCQNISFNDEFSVQKFGVTKSSLMLLACLFETAVFLRLNGMCKKS